MDNITINVTEIVELITINITEGGGGDMLKSVYDPDNIEENAFDSDNHINGTNNKVFTTTEQSKLSGIEAGATAYTDAMADSRVVAGITGKQDKETGKGLSTNDYTTAEQSKLSGIATGAEVNVNADWNAASGDAQILNKPTISGSNTGDETAARIATIITGSGEQTAPLDADEFPFYKIVGTVLSKVTWANIKATLKTYFDTLYHPKTSYVGAGLIGGMSGQWWDACITATQNSSIALAVNRACFMPFVWSGGSNLTIDRLALDSTVVATSGTSARLAIYASDSITQAPTGNPLADIELTALNAGTGLKYVDVSLTLTKGVLYWLAVFPNCDVTVRTITLSSAYNLGCTGAGSSAVHDSYLQKTITYPASAAPNNIQGIVTLADRSSTYAPIAIKMRKA